MTNQSQSQGLTSPVTNLPLDAYIRVSRVNGREGDSFLSPDIQRASIEAWSQANDVPVNFLPEHIDLDQSGAKEHRPGLDRILERISTGKSGGIVVAKLDRLSRKASHGLALIEELVQKQGKRVVIVGSGADAATSEGRLILGILLNVAEWQREGLKASFASTTANANARGVHQGEVIGYLRTKGQPLAVIPAAVPIIRTVFEMRAANASWTTLCDFLDASGLKPARAASWSINSVSNMIGNAAYMGTATQGEHVRKNAHEAIVTPALFAAANANAGSSHARTNDYLLTGLVRCLCRYTMVGSEGNYKCRGRHGAGTCDHRARINAKALESYVIAEAFKAHDVLVSSTHVDLDIEALDAAIAEAEAEARAFTLNVKASSPNYGAGMAARDAEVEQAHAAKAQALAQYAPEGTSLLFSLSEQWDSLSMDEKRSNIKALVSMVIIGHNGEAQIVWRGQEKAVGPVPKSGAGQKDEARSGLFYFAWPILAEDGKAPVRVAALQAA